ncbi:MAG TPA: hypothetical protein VMF29_04475, partial [Candidatus Edwardsbacteria bacterium]|nr:hypothetical protein [Candidatus Edwardsbacteria bacterium]
MKKFLFAAALLASLAAAAQAAPDTVRIFLWDNDAGESPQQTPAAVMAAGYNSLYAWADARDGNWNIYGRVWTRKPQAATDAFLVNQVRIDEHIQQNPDVAGTTGTFYFAVWQDSLQKSGEVWQIFGRKLDKNGKPMTDEFLVTEAVKGNAVNPQIAVDPKTQDFVVVWQDDRDGQFDVWARLFDFKCSPRTGDIKINDDGTKYPHINPVVSSSINGIAIAWQDYRYGSRASIFYRYYKTNLTPTDTSKRVNDDKSYTELNHVTPAIAAQDTGFFTIVWLDFRNHVYGDIYSSRYDPSGAVLDQNVKVNPSTTPVACRTPSVAAGPDRTSFWTCWADSSSSTYKYQIRSRYYDQYGRWGTTVKVVNENWANGQRTPDVCRYGNFFSLAWLDSSRAQGLGDIFGQYYALDSKDDTLDEMDVNYNISADRANGRRIWYHPAKDYDNPMTAWNEDPIAEPDSVYVPLDSAYVLAIAERNIPGQMFFKVDDTDTLAYMWRKQGKINSKQYDICVMDLGYAADGASAGVIQPEQRDSLVKFANDTSKCLLVAGNDFGEMYNQDTLFSFFGSKYVGPGNPQGAGNIQKLT